MTNTITRLKWIFLGVFAVGVIAVWTYHLVWAWPQKRCESEGRWWSGETLTCATPLYLPSITGRPAGVSREAWSKRQAAAQQQRDRLGERALAGQPAAKPAEAPAPEKK